jgi:hypothetical protein
MRGARRTLTSADSTEASLDARHGTAGVACFRFSSDSANYGYGTTETLPGSTLVEYSDTGPEFSASKLGSLSRFRALRRPRPP